MNTLKNLLLVTGLTINDIINLRSLRANDTPTHRLLTRDRVVRQPYTPDASEAYRWVNRRSIWQGAAQILLQTMYHNQPDFWAYSWQERELLKRPNRQWLARHAGWLLTPRPALSPQERQRRVGRNRPTKVTYDDYLETQERRGFEAWSCH